MENETAYKKYGKNAFVHDGVKAPLAVISSPEQRGFFIGTTHENGSTRSRESVQIWQSSEAAVVALADGHWQQLGAFQIDKKFVTSGAETENIKDQAVAGKAEPSPLSMGEPEGQRRSPKPRRVEKPYERDGR